MTPVSFIPPKLEYLKAQQKVLCLFNFDEKAPLKGITGLVDWRLLGQLSKLTISGFISGKCGESLLFPLGNRLPPEHLVMIGVGRSGAFHREQFDNALSQMFRVATGLNCRHLALALPGRPENTIEATDAIDWFLSHFEQQNSSFLITIIDTYEAQPIIISEVERRRMKASVTPPLLES